MRWIWILCVISAPVMAGKVLLIESYEQGYEWDASYVSALKQSLTPAHELHTFEMDTKRVPASRYSQIAEQAFSRYQHLKPQVVVLGDDNALVYMLPKLYNEPISIVFLGINSNPRKFMAQYQGQAKVTGILERPLYVKTMGEIGRMLDKDKRKVLVLFDSGSTASIALEFMQTQASMIEKNLGIATEIASVAIEKEWQTRISTAKEQGFGAIVVGLYQTLVDESENNVPADTVLTWTNQHTEVPLFGFWDFSIGAGKAAGGVVLAGRDQGEMAGKTVLRILNNNEDASRIPIQIGQQGRAIYHQGEMSRWGLSVPEGWMKID
ncbi:hypothetical protein [Vibrio sp. 2-2(8)]|uniref:ABC transporter substrate-binding protein n=1 Tax=Vibrio sp. 2-2(8) TaxID=2591014 RepID=UPI0014820202|nr:hypothetical protein [Vibrio sp. 2-2(8)]NNN48788.1 hypothetical protein [Vibrio sp. 2-2(8)]